MLTSIPTLDELAASPELAAKLPSATALALIRRCASVLETLGHVVALDEQRREDPADIVDKHEAARIVGMSVSWVEKHIRILPPRVSIGGTPRWRRGDLLAWRQERHAYGDPRPVARHRPSAVPSAGRRAS